MYNMQTYTAKITLVELALFFSDLFLLLLMTLFKETVRSLEQSDYEN